VRDLVTETAAQVASPDAVTRSAGDPRHRRRVALAVVLVIAAAGAAAGLIATGTFRGSKPPSAASVDQTALATVKRQSLTSQAQVSATLGYAGSYDVILPPTGASSPSSSSASTGTAHGVGGQSGGQATGVFTALPAAGQVVSQGQSLYSVNQSPTMLLYGAVPAYRTLSEGMSGTDVQQLNADLVALGDASSSQLDPASAYFSAATAAGLDKLQAALGLPQTGDLPLGQTVFLPTAARVTNVAVSVGAPAQPGASILQATSTTRDVIAQLDATQQAEIKAGDQVTITLPNGQTTPGVVTSVGTVATSSSSGGQGSSSGGGGGSGSTPTIQVDIKPTDPSATGSLDQAPVNVTITTGEVKDALVVPVDALLAQGSGGYAVEVVDGQGIHHLVPVSLGLFDDADGLVQVTSSQLQAGQQVVVPKL
jgi:hypothetical protein